MIVGSRLLVVRLRLRALVRRIAHKSAPAPVRDQSPAIDVRRLSTPDSAAAGHVAILDVAHPGQAWPAELASNAASVSVVAPSRRVHDADSVHAEIVEFLDRVEARELGRPKFAPSSGQGLDTVLERGERDAASSHDEADRVLRRAKADAAELVRHARGEAEHTLEWSRAQGAEIVRRSQRLAVDRFRTVEHSEFTVDLERL